MAYRGSPRRSSVRAAAASGRVERVPPPAARRRAARSASQRGDGGERQTPIRTTAATTSGGAQIARHAAPSRPAAGRSEAAEVAKPIMMPSTMSASFAETSSPRISDGAISEMYTGAACIEKAMPSPYTARPPRTAGSTAAASDDDGATHVSAVPAM